MADDMVASAVDDVNWPQFSERLDLCDPRWRDAFGGLYFLALIFLELQRFYDHFVSFLLTFRLIAILTDVIKF